MLSITYSGSIPGCCYMVWALGGDILLVMSLFVLGGDFWDNIRALFMRDAKATFTSS